ncbi:hypothetical protein PYCC9005_003391 [Savitreella phatthalungensis]
MVDFGDIQVGTRRQSSIASLAAFQSARGISQSAGHGLDHQSLGDPSQQYQAPSAQAQAERRRSSILSLANLNVRRRSSAISLNFANRKDAGKAVDEPILLSREKEGYLFFSMTSDGLLNYKVANRVQGAMSKYLVDPKLFNPEGAPVVVLSSPESGSGLATQTYSRLLLPIFKHFKVAHSHINLKDENMAHYLASNGQFTPNTIFVLLSGDGVLHEVVNGLSQNPHFSQINTPIRLAVVPCGSGNGMSSSLKMTTIAQGLRGLFKNNWQPLQVMSVRSQSLGLQYACVVFSYGFHAAVVHDSQSPQMKQAYGSNRFKEAAIKHLKPKPYSYRGALVLSDALRHPDFEQSSRAQDQVVGGREHSYILVTRCSNLESDWKIAPLASPMGNPGKLDVVRMSGDLNASELSGVLMSAYSMGAQINDPRFEYYRATGAVLAVGAEDEDRRRVCIDGAIHTVQYGEQVEIGCTYDIGPQQTRILMQKL